MNRPLHLPHGPRAYGVAGVVLLALSALFDATLTRSMAAHMLLHIPMILLAGACAGAALACSRLARAGWCRRAALGWGKCNEQGIPGLLLGSLLGAYWMIPKALDDVLLHPFMAFWKYGGLFITGMVLFDSLSRANIVVKLFFLGNFSWMMAIVGLVYQDETSRLCNAYLLSDQELAGKGLVVLAVLLPIVWLLGERSRLRRLMSK